jgi:phosphoadenosine phosphosulfate reductase
MGLLAVNTLHLFPETLEVAERVQKAYNKKAAVYLPAEVSTRAEFVAKYGDAEVMNHADFDLHSKVEPYTRGLAALGRDILITGRRSDQGEKRIALDEWENQSRTFNPMANWSWSDIIAYVDKYDVPVNSNHNLVRNKISIFSLMFVCRKKITIIFLSIFFRYSVHLLQSKQQNVICLIFHGSELI